jgi:hypothetical protein
MRQKRGARSQPAVRRPIPGLTQADTNIEAAVGVHTTVLRLADEFVAQDSPSVHVASV